VYVDRKYTSRIRPVSNSEANSNIPSVDGRKFVRCSIWAAVILYHFNQFVGHASRASTKYHDCHCHFAEVTKSSGDYVPNIEFFRRLRRQSAENFGHFMGDLTPVTIFSSGASRVKVPDELIEMVQQVYLARPRGLGSPQTFGQKCGQG
jgi:hypothetical protein